MFLWCREVIFAPKEEGYLLPWQRGRGAKTLVILDCAPLQDYSFRPELQVMGEESEIVFPSSLSSL
jgi:hypothetical protein